jgi:hypothetical protein
MLKDASHRIFNIQENDQRNMLFNQDKYQNPVNMLKNKFDIKSGATES